MHTSLLVEYGVFVRIIKSSATYKLRRQGRFSLEAACRNYYCPAFPANDPRVNEYPPDCVFGNCDSDGGAKRSEQVITLGPKRDRLLFFVQRISAVVVPRIPKFMLRVGICVQKLAAGKICFEHSADRPNSISGGGSHDANHAIRSDDDLPCVFGFIH